MKSEIQKKRFSFKLLSIAAGLAVLFVVLFSTQVHAGEVPDDQPEYEYQLGDVATYEWANDPNTLAVYHFDGNSINSVTGIKDPFLWIEGYTTGTYGDAMVLSGERRLTFNDSDGIGTGDFTLEFIGTRMLTAPLPSASIGYGFLGFQKAGLLNIGLPYNTQEPDQPLEFMMNRGTQRVSLNFNQTYHYCFERKDGVCRFYLDGQENMVFDMPEDVGNNFYFRHNDNSGKYPTNFVIDEIRLSHGARYGGNYIPATEPFDIEKVPIKPTMANNGDLLVDSDIPVTKIYIGEDAPLSPVEGGLFVQIYYDGSTHNVIGTMQYVGGAWVPVECEIYQPSGWTGAVGSDVTPYAAVKPKPHQPPPEGAISPFLMVMSLVYSLFQYELNVYGFVFSFWDILMFGLVVSVIFGFVRYIFYEN